MMPICKIQSQPVTVAVKAFDAYLARRSRASGTRRNYRQHLQEFARWAGERTAAEITASDIEFDFIATWHREFERRLGRVPSLRTVRNKIQALRSFYEFLDRFDLLRDADGNPVRSPMRAIDLPSVPPKANDWLRADEDEALLRAEMNEQERIIVFLLRFTGLRVGEAVALEGRDVDPTTDTVTVRVSKTPRGRREVVLVPELKPHLERWRLFKACGEKAAPSLPHERERQWRRNTSRS